MTRLFRRAGNDRNQHPVIASNSRRAGNIYGVLSILRAWKKSDSVLETHSSLSLG